MSDIWSLFDKIKKTEKVSGPPEYIIVGLGNPGKDYEKTFEGVSGISLVTNQAFSLFDKVKDSLVFEEKDYDSFIPFQSWGHTYNVNEQLRSKILDCLRNKDKNIKDCINILQPNKDKNVYIKHVLSYLPLCVEQKVRKIIK